jgi:Mitochondrial carrier protein
MPPNTAIARGTVIAMSRFEGSTGATRKRARDRSPRRRRPRLVGHTSLPCVIFALACIALLSNPSPPSLLDIGSCTVVAALGTDSDTNDYNDPESASRSRSLVRKSISEEAPARPQKPQDEATLTLNQIFVRAGRRGLGGGVPGAIAGVVQVVTLMWLRTIMSYQSRYGGTFLQALRTLLNEGGVARLYKGWYFGLIQAPVTRFVSTAANDGVESLLRSLEWTKAWGPGRSTIVASVFVGLFRMVLMRKSIVLLRRVHLFCCYRDAF